MRLTQPGSLEYQGAPIQGESFEVAPTADRQTLALTINNVLIKAQRLRDANRAFWSEVEIAEFDNKTTHRLERIRQELQSNLPIDLMARIEAVRLIEEQIELFRQIDMRQAIAGVGKLVSGYIRERQLIPRREIESLSPEQAIDLARERGINLDEAMRAAITEYTAHQLTNQVRLETVNRLSGLHNDNTVAVLNWIIALLMGSLGTIAAHGFTYFMAKATGTVPSPASSDYRLAQAITGALSSGVASYATGKNRITEGYQELGVADKTLDERIGHQFPEGLPATARHEQLLAYYTEQARNGRFAGNEKEALALLEAIAKSKSEAELQIATEGTARIPNESVINYWARILVRYKLLQAFGSEALRREEIVQLISERYRDRTNRLADPRLWEAVAWGAIGGTFSYYHPEILYSPTAPANSLSLLATSTARARYAMSRPWEWAGRYERYRLEKRREKTPDTELEGLLQPKPFRVMPRFDERTFYLHRPIASIATPTVRHQIEQSQHMSEAEKRRAENLVTYLRLILPSYHGYFFFSPNHDTNSVKAYRLWPCSMEKGNPYSQPDTSNFPHLQETPELQHSNGLPYGEFVVRELLLESLFDKHPQTGAYQPMPELDTEEFKLSWNMPDHRWIQLGHAKDSTVVPYTEVLPYRYHGQLTQAFIRPDLIGRFAYEINNGLPYEALTQSIIEAQEAGIDNIEQILTRARELANP